jgi:hypothetical protein
MAQRPVIPITAETPKRGRGRPRSPEALTPAQRAKRYRDNKKRAGAGMPDDASPRDTVINRDVTQNTGPSIGALEARLILVNAENLRLADELVRARDRGQALSKALGEALRAHAARTPLPPERVRALDQLLAPPAKRKPPPIP